MVVSSSPSFDVHQELRYLFLPVSICLDELMFAFKIATFLTTPLPGNENFQRESNSII